MTGRSVRLGWWRDGMSRTEVMGVNLIPRDRFEGCLLGLALGDALGAAYEGGLVERSTWRTLGRAVRGETWWTDDTTTNRGTE